MHDIDVITIDDAAVISDSVGCSTEPLFDESLGSLDSISIDVTDRDDIAELGELFAQSMRTVCERRALIPATSASHHGNPWTIICISKPKRTSFSAEEDRC